MLVKTKKKVTNGDISGVFGIFEVTSFLNYLCDT